MSKIIDKINSFTGTDWILNKIFIDSDHIKIECSNENYITTLLCNNFIGISFVGNWEESVIEQISVDSHGDLIEESIKKIKFLYKDGKIPNTIIKNINDIWYQLNIKLIDGNVIQIACNEFDIIFTDVNGNIILI